MAPHPKRTDVNISKLDKAVADLFKHVDNIQDERDRKSSGKVMNPIKKQYVHYKRAYQLLEPDEKIFSFYSFYSDYHHILINRKSRNWPNHNAYLIIDREDNTMRMNVTGYYRYADIIMKDAMDDIRGLPDSAAESRTELIYPDLLEMYLYRCISEVVTDQDVITILASIATDLNEEVTQPVRPSAPVGVNPAIADMMNMATNLFKGISNTSDGNPNPLVDGLSEFMKNDNVKKMSEIMGKLQTSQPHQIMETMKEIYNNPDVQRMVRSVIDPNIPHDVSGELLRGDTSIPVVSGGGEETFAPAGEGVVMKFVDE